MRQTEITQRLTTPPAVGDGVTVHGWSDSHAYTVVSVSASGKSFVAQRDKATRTNRQDDTFSPGGFFGHTESPNGQQWSYERDELGDQIKLTLRKDGFYRQVGVSYRQAAVSEGRHEHYDYNF